MKIQNLKLKMTLLLATCCLLLATAPSAQASALSLSIEPSIITINAIPPTTTTSSIKIQNKSDNQVTLKVQLNPFKSNLENGEIEYLSSQDYSQIFNNISILDGDTPVSNITLEPKQQKKLTLNITVPQDTNILARPPATSSSQSQTSQDYYFSIIFISQNSSSAESNSSLNQAGIATNILLSVGPKETPKAILEEFSSNLLFGKGPVPFTVRVKNQGTHLIKPKGEIIIKNMFGQSIGKLDLVRVNILADSTRAIPSTTYMEELKEKSLDSKTKTSVDFKNPKALWKEGFLLGLYEATLSLSLSDEGPVFTKSIRFFAFPLQGLVMIIAIAVTAIVVKKRLNIYMNKNRT